MSITRDEPTPTTPTGEGDPVTNRERATPGLYLPAALAAVAVALAAVGAGDYSNRTTLLAAALVCGMFAFGLFTTWVRAHADTGGSVVRFLEQIRRALAYEEPLPPRQPGR